MRSRVESLLGGQSEAELTEEEKDSLHDLLNPENACPSRERGGEKNLTPKGGYPGIKQDKFEGTLSRNEREEEQVTQILNERRRRDEQSLYMEQARQAYNRQAPQEQALHQERVRHDQARQQPVRPEVAHGVSVQRPPLPVANALPAAPWGSMPVGQTSNSNLRENSIFGTLRQEVTTDPQGIFAGLSRQLGTAGHNSNFPDLFNQMRQRTSDSTQNSNSFPTSLSRR